MFSVQGPSRGITLFPHSGVLDKLLRTGFPGVILIHSCAHKILVYYDKCIGQQLFFTYYSKFISQWFGSALYRPSKYSVILVHFHSKWSQMMLIKQNFLRQVQPEKKKHHFLQCLVTQNKHSLTLKGRRRHISLAASHIKLDFTKVNRRKYIYH